MALKSTLQSLDGVEDALKAHYTEKDGVFVLDVDGIDQHPELTSLKNAYERQKQDNTTLRQERDTARNELTNATKGKPDEAALAAERQGYETRIADLEGKLSAANTKLSGMTIDGELKSALADAGITNPAFIKAATAMLRGQIKIEGDKAVGESAMGPKPLAEFVKGWAAGEDGKAFVTPATGGGATGSDKGTPKPFKEMTEAERVTLHRTNPAEYQRLRAAG